MVNLLEVLHQNYDFENKDFFKQRFIELGLADGSKPKFWFKLFSQRYLYKIQHDKTYESYGEIIGEELAKLYGLPSAHYELASFDLDSEIFKGSQGVITQDFLDDDDILIPMSEIMVYVITNYESSEFNIFNEEPFQDLYAIKGLNEGQYKKKLNNLEDIWSIIDFYINHHPRFNTFNEQRKTQLIQTIMNNLVDIFIFDLLTLQGDRHPANFSFIFNKEKKEFKVAPLYDNSNIFRLNTKSSIKTLNELKIAREKQNNISNSKNKIDKIDQSIYNSLYKSQMWLSVTGEDIKDDKFKKIKQLDMLEKFLNYSDESFIEYLEEKLCLFENVDLFQLLATTRPETDIPIEIIQHASDMLKYNIANIKEKVSNYRKDR